MITIRKAILSDAKPLAELAEATFREAFSESNNADDMQAHCESNYSESIQAKEIASSTYVTLVAEDNQQLIAYAQLRWEQTPSCVTAESPGEIQRFYVDKNYHGKGLAQKLMSACLDVMKTHNTDAVWLSAWEENPRAISFYQKFNFQAVGENEFLLGSDRQRDIIMACQIKEGK